MSPSPPNVFEVSDTPRLNLAKLNLDNEYGATLEKIWKTKIAVLQRIIACAREATTIIGGFLVGLVAKRSGRNWVA